MEAWVIPAGVLLVLIVLAPGRIAERLIGLVFQFVLWVVKLPFRASGTFLKTSLAWLNMEVRRWVGVLVGGALVLTIAQAIVRSAPPGSIWRLVALLMCLIWLVAFFSAARLTLEYLSLRRVRQTRAFVEINEGVRDLQGQVASLQDQVVGTAVKTRRTPVEDAFTADRSARAEERAAAERAAQQAEADRLAAEEARRERVLDSVSPDHDPFQ
jgi:hypothetical protein